MKLVIYKYGVNDFITVIEDGVTSTVTTNVLSGSGSQETLDSDSYLNITANRGRIQPVFTFMGLNFTVTGVVNVTLVFELSDGTVKKVNVSILVLCSMPR